MALVIKFIMKLHFPSHFLFLVSYVEEKPWWPIQSPTKEERGKQKAKEKERGLRFES